MIRLTNDASGEEGKPLYISAESITSVRPWVVTTRIDTINQKYFVAESPEEVARKVLEYRLAMVRYGAWYQAGAKSISDGGQGGEDNPFLKCFGEKKFIEKLAGLDGVNV